MPAANRIALQPAQMEEKRAMALHGSGWLVQYSVQDRIGFMDGHYPANIAPIRQEEYSGGPTVPSLPGKDAQRHQVL